MNYIFAVKVLNSFGEFPEAIATICHCHTFSVVDNKLGKVAIFRVLQFQDVVNSLSSWEAHVFVRIEKFDHVWVLETIQNNLLIEQVVYFLHCLPLHNLQSKWLFSLFKQKNLRMAASAQPNKFFDPKLH